MWKEASCRGLYKGPQGESGFKIASHRTSNVLALRQVRAYPTELPAVATTGKLRAFRQNEATARKAQKSKSRGVVHTVSLAGSPECISIKLGKHRFGCLVDTRAAVSLMSDSY